MFAIQQIRGRIEDFTFQKRIGAGAYGEVHKVIRNADQKVYAMKIQKLSKFNPKERQNALNEIRILASIDSPYIVSYRDSFFDEKQGLLYLVMEFASGGDLDHIIMKYKKEKKLIKENVIWNVLVQLAQGLNTLHQMGILHRDVKCANIFVSKSKEGRVYKLGDLNLSKITKGGDAQTMLGTPYYMAPEVFQGTPYSYPCDIWSLGCLIYELAAQRTPFKGSSIPELIKAIKSAIKDPLPNYYSKDLFDMINFMLQVYFYFFTSKLNPQNRLTAKQILNHPLVIKNYGEKVNHLEQQEQKQNFLINSINFVENIGLIKSKLPKAQYIEDISELQQHINYLRMSKVDQIHQQSQVQLPKLQVSLAKEKTQKDSFDKSSIKSSKLLELSIEKPDQKVYKPFLGRLKPLQMPQKKYQQIKQIGYTVKLKKSSKQSQIIDPLTLKPSRYFKYFSKIYKTIVGQLSDECFIRSFYQTRKSVGRFLISHSPLNAPIKNRFHYIISQLPKISSFIFVFTKEISIIYTLNFKQYNNYLFNSPMESTIKDFNILNKLGEGSFSQVYKVQRISDQKMYAMKKVKMSLLSAKERENSLNEIRILASISSPYIIQYKDSFLDPDSNILCVIMEFASGGKVKGGVEESEIWSALVQMTMGIRTLHDLDILHRDLKLANVFVDKGKEGNIYKLGDLNISKVTKGANAKTQAGTPYYAAPEVWRGDQYSWPCDMWSLGCIIYELAAQRPPFRAQDLTGLNKKIQSGVYDALPSKYSKDLSTIIGSLLKLNPKLRPKAQDILNNPIVIKNSGSIVIEQEQNGQKDIQLLKTIKLPRNLQMLKGNLPKANYDQQINHNGRASSAGPKRQEEYQSTPQPEKSKAVEQLLQQQKQVQKPPQQQQQQQGRPPIQSAKPPMMPSQQSKQQQEYLLKLQNQEQRLVGPQTPQSSRQNSRVQQNYSNRPAGVPSGMGRRQLSAQQVQRR